jgi:RNA polymerase sigma factor (sigma-70 family)
MSSSQIAVTQNESVSHVKHLPIEIDPDERSLPESVRALLDSSGNSDAAWGAFVAEYTRILLHVVKLMPGDRDERMDAYTRILESLRANDYRKLRGYAVMPHSSFTTWLVVVAKRICIDYNRSKFGRGGEAMSRARLERRATRHRLEDLLTGAGDPEILPLADGEQADTRTRERDLMAAVASVLSSLPPADRLLISLRFKDNLSAAEIARLLREPSALSVYRRIGKLLAKLRSALALRGIDGPLP